MNVIIYKIVINHLPWLISNYTNYMSIYLILWASNPLRGYKNEKGDFELDRHGYPG